jgi:hypothetical protein
MNGTFMTWKQLPAGLPASFPCKLNTFRKRVKNVVTSKGIQVGFECHHHHHHHYHHVKKRGLGVLPVP